MTFTSVPRDASGRFAEKPEVGMARRLTQVLRQALGHDGADNEPEDPAARIAAQDDASAVMDLAVVAAEKAHTRLETKTDPSGERDSVRERPDGGSAWVAGDDLWVQEPGAEPAVLGRIDDLDAFDQWQAFSAVPPPPLDATSAASLADVADILDADDYTEVTGEILAGKVRVAPDVYSDALAFAAGLETKDWDPKLHPRDFRGRFISLGSIVSLPNSGGSARVIGTAGPGKIQVRKADGNVEDVNAKDVEVIQGAPAKPDAQVGTLADTQTGKPGEAGKPGTPGTFQATPAAAPQPMAEPAKPGNKPPAADAMDLSNLPAARTSAVQYLRGRAQEERRAGRGKDPRALTFDAAATILGDKGAMANGGPEAQGDALYRRASSDPVVKGNIDAVIADMDTLADALDAAGSNLKVPGKGAPKLSDYLRRYAASYRREPQPNPVGASGDSLVAKMQEGGFTVKQGAFRQDGFAVAVPDRGKAFGPGELTPQAVDAYIAANWDELSANPRLHLGGWLEDDGTAWLDLSEVYDTKEEAYQAGKDRGEIAIADLAAFASGGDGTVPIAYDAKPPTGPAAAKWDDPTSGVLKGGTDGQAGSSTPAGAGGDAGGVRGPGQGGAAAAAGSQAQAVTATEARDVIDAAAEARMGGAISRAQQEQQLRDLGARMRASGVSWDQVRAEVANRPGSEQARMVSGGSTDSELQSYIDHAQALSDAADALNAAEQASGFHAEAHVAMGDGPQIDTPPDVSQAMGGIAHTDGTPDAAGTADDPIDVQGDLDKAVELLAAGKHVRLNQPDQVATLVDKLAQRVKDAKASGREVDPIDLCQVSVPDTNLFCKDTKGIARINMPQLSGEVIPGSAAEAKADPVTRRADISAEFRKALEDRGVTVTDTRVPASHLRATQGEIDGVKVSGMAAAMDAGKIPEAPIYVTRDGYIIDGHHRWAAMLSRDTRDNTLGNLDMPVHVIDADIGEMIDFANAFSVGMGIKQQGLADRAVDPGAASGAPLPSPSASLTPDAPRELRMAEAQLHASALATRARQIEPGATDTLQRIVGAHGGEMAGLDYRFKSEDRLAEKIVDKAEQKGMTVAQYAAKVGDALRYTAVVPPEGHIAAARETLADLERQGYQVLSAENTWPRGDDYSGINVNVMAPNGSIVEIQFHTADSLATKEAIHPLYETFRRASASVAEKTAAWQAMVAAWGQVEQPPGWVNFGQIITRRPPPYIQPSTTA